MTIIARKTSAQINRKPSPEVTLTNLGQITQQMTNYSNSTRWNVYLRHATLKRVVTTCSFAHSALTAFTTSLSLFTQPTAEKEHFIIDDHELWPMTLTFKPDLDMVRVQQQAKYLGHGLFSYKS